MKLFPTTTRVIFSLGLLGLMMTSCQSGKQATYLDPSSRLSAAKQAAEESRDKAQQDPRRSHTVYLDQARVDFYERMEQKAKDRAVMAKELKKPQYSDPMYFGHKKPPQKRPRGKKRMCTECGMMH